jgi:release factor glutamine methyltransferase
VNRWANVRDLLEDASARLGGSDIPNPHFEAELIFAEAAGLSRAQVLAGLAAAGQNVCRRFYAMLERRSAREPLAYILGRKEFYSLELQVGPGVLVPRPETETVVDAALRFLAGRTSRTVLDIGTGSGAIALAIASNGAGARVFATEVSAEAAAVARHNTVALGLAPRLAIIEADCWPNSEDAPERFDLIVSNPPYIRDADIGKLEAEISRYEPRIALSGGVDGLDFYRRIAAGLGHHLKPDGAVIVEVGDDQAGEVATIFQLAGLAQIEIIKDLAGIPRVVQARRA